MKITCKASLTSDLLFPGGKGDGQRTHKLSCQCDMLTKRGPFHFFTSEDRTGSFFLHASLNVSLIRLEQLFGLKLVSILKYLVYQRYPLIISRSF